MDFKFRNCSDLYFEKNPLGIKYLQKISSCVNNRKIQYFVSGPVFNKFENFMILLLLFIAYFICQCLFSQAAWIRVFDHLVPTEHPKFPCRELVALAPAPPPPPPAETCPARRTDGPCQGHVSSAVPCPASGPCPSTAPRRSRCGATGGPGGAEGAARAPRGWRAAEGDGDVAPTLMGSSPQVIKPRLMLTVM